MPALDDTAGRFAALVTSAPDTTVQVPGSPGWTVRDVAAHVATVTVRYCDGRPARIELALVTQLGVQRRLARVMAPGVIPVVAVQQAEQLPLDGG